jgi:hypothetical protein
MQNYECKILNFFKIEKGLIGMMLIKPFVLI